MTIRPAFTTPRPAMRLALSFSLALAPALAAHAAAPCTLASGARTAALVELYTSEGCSSCPPADRALNALQRAAGPDALVVPLALHVTYWDQIGWRDPFGQDAFDARQRALLDAQKLRTAYTPQFFVNGRALRGWQDRLGETIGAIHARPAPVQLTLATRPAGQGVSIDVRAVATERHTTGALYLALSESGLASTVLRGENGGATLHHDAAARLLLGPVPLVDGRAALQRTLTLPPGWQRARLQAVAFVQAGEGGTILQALSSAACGSGQGL